MYFLHNIKEYTNHITHINRVNVCKKLEQPVGRIKYALN